MRLASIRNASTRHLKCALTTLTPSHVRCLSTERSRPSAQQKPVTSATSTVPISGSGALAVVMGGFGVTARQLRRHEELYTEHGFESFPIVSSIRELATPDIARARGKALAKELEAKGREIVLHTVSGSVFTAMWMLQGMKEEWRERHVRAILFDSCPPRVNHAAFGGWASWFCQAKFAIPVRHSRAILTQAFMPAFRILGIDDAVKAEVDDMVDGAGCVIPRAANCLFAHGRNDPVLEASYVERVASFLQNRPGQSGSIETQLFEKAQHALAVLEEPIKYKRAAINDLMAMVPEWTMPPTRLAHMEPTARDATPASWRAGQGVASAL